MGLSQDASIYLSIIAKDLASGNLSKVSMGLDEMTKHGGVAGGVLGGIGSKLSGMVNPAALAGQAMGAVTDFLKDGVQSAIDEEASLKSLDTALENNVEGWDGNRDAIDKAIDSRMDLAFSDDDLRASMGKLVTATGSVNKALDHQKLAMDIARGKNIDLASATDIVIKASMGNTKALKAMGIELEKGATKTEILAELQKRFGGQSEAYADSTKGSMEAMQLAIGEVGEDIGAMLLPALKDAAMFVKDQLIPAIKGIADAFGGAVDGVTDFGLKLGGLEGGLQALRDYNALVEEMAKKYGVSIEEVKRWEGAHKNAAGSAETDLAQLRIAMDTAFAADAREMATLGARSTDAFIKAARERAEAEKERLNQVGSFMASEITDRYRSVAIEKAQAATDEMIGNVASTLRGGVGKIDSAMDDLTYVMTHQWEIQARLATIAGELTGEKLGAGLRSSNPYVHAQAVVTQNILLDEWKKLTGRAYDEGKDAGNAYMRGLNSQIGGIRNPFRDPNRDPGHSGPGGRQFGGPVRKGVPYIVGEKRPEVFVPNENGYIDPHPERHGRGGGTTINLMVPVTFQSVAPPTPSEGRKLAEMIGPELVRWLRGQRINIARS